MTDCSQCGEPVPKSETGDMLYPHHKGDPVHAACHPYSPELSWL